MGESSVGDSGGGDGEHITHIGDMGVDIENRLRLALDAKVDEVGAQSDSSQAYPHQWRTVVASDLVDLDPVSFVRAAEEVY